ncbi:MAG TPA: VWA domain-containing protein [Vicinamibacterales bacterium]|jgi:Flp pilus assembly protein TadG|nr:VWA domain-containing protein [Vicinamibacterales bacterium]
MRLKNERGFTLAYLAASLSGMLLFSGLAVDAGRAYAVKAQLTKAVDGAALGAARTLNSGDPRGEATRIFQANFPAGFLGTTGGDPTGAGNFFSLQTNAQSGTNTVTVQASVQLPTTFMRLGNINTVTVGSLGQATRRMVDLSLVLDVSSSIGPQWGAVHDAARTFVDAFDQNNDRMALLTFSDGAKVIDQMSASRGFNKTQVEADVPGTLPGGSTQMVEGMYRGWDELRSVPAGTQSGVRVIVLFTDGASNSVPAFYDSPVIAKGLRTYDFPQNPGDTNGQTWASPHTVGLFDTQSGSETPSFDVNGAWNCHCLPAGIPATAQNLPAQSAHTHHRSAGIPTSFPLSSNTLKVDGMAQSAARPFRDLGQITAGKYPSQVWNINNAARNLVEIIADAAKNDNGDYKIRIFTIGMGQLVRLALGTRPETSESMLMRLANDPASPDYNPNELQGKYFYAETAADVGPAFQNIQNQILRLSQ